VTRRSVEAVLGAAVAALGAGRGHRQVPVLATARARRANRGRQVQVVVSVAAIPEDGSAPKRRDIHRARAGSRQVRVTSRRGGEVHAGVGVPRRTRAGWGGKVDTAGSPSRSREVRVSRQARAGRNALEVVRVEVDDVVSVLRGHRRGRLRGPRRGHRAIRGDVEPVAAPRAAHRRAGRGQTTLVEVVDGGAVGALDVNHRATGPPRG